MVATSGGPRSGRPALETGSTMFANLILATGLTMAISAHDAKVAYRTVVYAAPAGDPLKASLFLPPEGKPELRPAILLIHGSGWLVGTRRLVHWYARRFAENGYVTLAINYRKMPRYPYPHCVHDAKAGVRWLRLNARDLRIDPDRIGAFGNSAGGNLAGLLAATNPKDGMEGASNFGPSSAVRAAVILYGAVDLTLYAKPEKETALSRASRRYIARVVGARDENDLAAFEAASPVTYADEETAPVLLIHGKKDHVVRVAQSQHLYDRLTKLGVPTRLVLVEPGRHGFDYVRRRQRAKVFREALAWFDRYLRDAGADGSP